MVTRRTDARRRRVLSEEFVPTDQDAVACSKKPMQAYSYGANRRNQPKTTDLIPKRAGAFGLFFIFVFSIIAGLNVLAANASSLVEFIGESATTSLAISGAGTLSNWICCVSLFLCSAICFQLFLIRKHKRDDYGGMYRVWILMAIMFLLASIDCAVDLRTIAAKLFEYLTHRSLLQSPWLMMTIESIVLAVIVIRMLFEVRASRFSLATVLVVWIGFVGCIVLQNTKLPEDIAWLDQNVAYGNCVLVGCVGSLVALTVYTRFVFLHAHGLIQLRIKKVAEAPEESSLGETAAETPSRKRSEPVKVSKPRIVTAEEPQPAAQPTAKNTRKKPRIVTQSYVSSQPAQQAAQPTKTASSKPARKKKASAPVSSVQTTAPLAAKQQHKSKSSQPAQSTKKKPKPVSASSPSSQPDELQEELENIDTVSMSKSERRRLRKLAKRAAREKRAA